MSTIGTGRRRYVLGLLLLCSACGNKPIGQKSIQHTLQAEGRFLDVLADDGYVMVGFSPTKEAEILRADSSGAVQWTVKLPSSLTELHSVDETPDHGFIVAAADASGGVLLKTDSAGAVTWSRSIPNSQSAMSAHPRVGGGYIVAGHVPFMVKPRHVYVAATDDGGAITWQHEVDVKPFASSKAHSLTGPDPLLATADGGLVVVGRVNADSLMGAFRATFDSQGIQTSEAILAGSDFDNEVAAPSVIDVNGDVAALVYASRQCRIAPVGPSTECLMTSPQQHRRTADAGFIIVGASIQRGPTFPFDPILVYVVKLDAGGSILWKHEMDVLGAPQTATCIERDSRGWYRIGVVGGGKVATLLLDDNGNAH